MCKTVRKKLQKHKEGMVSIHRYLIIIIATLLCPTLWAETESDPFDLAQYNKANAVYSRCFPSAKSQVRRNTIVADSLIQVGLSQKNYMVQILGLLGKIDVEFRAGQYNDAMRTCKELQELAKAHHSDSFYFMGRYKECDIMQNSNPAKSMMMARNLIHEAATHKYEPGLIYGYNLLGELNMYHRYEYRDAADNIRRAIELKKRNPDKGPDMVRLMTEYASALVESNDYKQATTVLDSIFIYFPEMDESDRIGIETIRLDMAYNQGLTGEAYDKVHQRATNSPFFKRIFIEDSQLFYHVRWLIRTGQTEEALKTIPKLELKEDRLRLSRDAYASIHEYEKAYKLDKLVKQAEDSILDMLRSQDFEAVDAQIKIIEMTEQAESMRNRQQATVAIMLSCFLAIALAVAIYTIRRRRAHMETLRLKNNELKEMNSQLELANRVKTEFMQNMTHELNTPLNAICGFASLLVSDEMEFSEEEKHEMAEAIHTNSTELTALINDIIHLNEYDDINYQPKMETLRPADLIISSMEGQTMPDGQNVRIIRKDQCPETFTLLTSKTMVKHLLRNVISNAIKFTNKGSITIESYLTDDDTWMNFAVTDTGIGIPADKREMVFERFYKIDTFVHGTGLGLSICRVIAERLHGTITLDETYTEQGTRIVFRLPVQH